MGGIGVGDVYCQPWLCRTLFHLVYIEIYTPNSAPLYLALPLALSPPYENILVLTAIGSTQISGSFRVPSLSLPPSLSLSIRPFACVLEFSSSISAASSLFFL